ncbi:antirestriction protein ArdA [Kitasatospora sp. NPDC127116]|uniref:antirestriction protein ArdA n=1 Tax=Kitasatospora sp. NPDC127116 TaxID=3345367 RepID=UPI00362F6522
MRIYVASLLDYSGGMLHGRWIDLEIYADTEAVMGEIRKMLDESPCATRGLGPAEDWAIHDTDDLPSGVEVGEFTSIERVCQMADIIRQVADREVIEAVISSVGPDFIEWESPDFFHDRWVTKVDSVNDFLYEEFQRAHEVADELMSYINLDRYRVDAEQDYDFVRLYAGYGVVFRNV